MTHGITGKTTIEIGGVTRTLSGDMNAAQVFYEQHGPHWMSWLFERLIGRAGGKRADGSAIWIPEPMSPVEEIGVLYALLSSDREDRGLAETEASLRSSFGIGEALELRRKLTRAVLACFGVPGEAIEVAEAGGGPPASAAAVANGTGTAS